MKLTKSEFPLQEGKSEDQGISSEAKLRVAS